jgi:hypothetical protein
VQSERTDARFVQSGFYERKQCSAFLSCKLAGAMVSKVVNVDSENHAGGSLLGNGIECVHESVLAPETAVCAIDKVRRVVKFLGLNGEPRQSPARSSSAAVFEFALSK